MGKQLILSSNIMLSITVKNQTFLIEIHKVIFLLIIIYSCSPLMGTKYINNLIQ